MVIGGYTHRNIKHLLELFIYSDKFLTFLSNMRSVLCYNCITDSIKGGDSLPMTYYVLLPRGVRKIVMGDIVIKNILHYMEEANPPTIITNESKELVKV